MKKAKIKIAGKNVTLAYCYATEIAYKDMSGEDISDFTAKAIEDISGEHPRMPDIRKSIYAIIASAMAYSQWKGVECPVTDGDLMTTASPDEMGSAIGTLIGLRAKFYALPSGEPSDRKEKGDKGKNS